MMAICMVSPIYNKIRSITFHFFVASIYPKKWLIDVVASTLIFHLIEIGLVFSVLDTRSKRMHWMDARALRRKDAFRGERPWGDTVCDPWISDRETVSKLRG